jgi:predicted tellurium resistance membrane protein TerC
VEWISDPNAWAALVTLAVLEIVLGIDNIIFISILAGRLPSQQQQRARVAGRRAGADFPARRGFFAGLGDHGGGHGR